MFFIKVGGGKTEDGGMQIVMKAVRETGIK